jgi:hypothetical protein
VFCGSPFSITHACRPRLASGVDGSTASAARTIGSTVAAQANATAALTGKRLAVLTSASFAMFRNQFMVRVKDLLCRTQPALRPALNPAFDIAGLDHYRSPSSAKPAFGQP